LRFLVAPLLERILSLHPPTDHLTGQRFGRSTGERPTDSGLTSSAAVGTCETKGL
jgi:hypothetical protein